MKIVSYNVNSIRARLERLIPWLDATSPDVVCVQEIKCEESAFPYEDLRQIGYHAAVFGQKTYNGVAILSREAPTDVLIGMNDGVDDPEARLVSAMVGGVRVISAYVPNGQDMSSDKYPYKLEWLQRLGRYLERECSPEEPMVLCGDFNIVPADIDCHDPEMWEGSVLFNPAVREAFDRLLGFGLVDVVRARHPGESVYSWWDYRMLAFPKNLGLRIDFVMATSVIANRLVDAGVERDERKGAKPSDHAPVFAIFK